MTMLREESASLNGHGTTRSYGAIDPETQADRDRDSELEEPDLAPRAEAVLHGLRDGVRANEGALREIGPDAAYLPILLYAAYLTGRPTEPVRIRSRERLSMDQRAAAIDGILKGKVSAYLDDGMRLVRQAEMEDEQHGERSDHEHVRDSRGDGTSPETAAEVEVEEMIWRRWRFDDKQLSVVDLLLPPYTNKPSLVLSHPLLVHSLDNAWRHGPPSSTESLESRFGRVRHKLLSYITPRRSHILSLGSHIILLCLTLLLSLEPRRWIHPYKQQSRHPHFWEGIYIAWAYSSIFDGFHCRLRTVFLLPTTCVPILAYLDSTWAFSFLAFSILPLTLLLILPYSPSLALLDSDYLPLSTLLVHLSIRGLRSAKFLVPLCLVVFAVFAWALNGDMFRGFFAVPALAPVTGTLSDRPFSLIINKADSSYAQAKPAYDAIPVEPGLAPFETRLMLFITLLTLLFLAMCVTLVRILTPAYQPSDSRVPPHQPDKWVTEYGPAVAGSARQRWAEAARTDIVRKEIVAPLNFTVEGIIPIDSVLFVLERLPRRWITPRLQRWMKRMQAWRDNIWVFIMGPLCFPLYVADRLASGREAWA